jgi:hypothetical protein
VGDVVVVKSCRREVDSKVSGDRGVRRARQKRSWRTASGVDPIGAARNTSRDRPTLFGRGPPASYKANFQGRVPNRPCNPDTFNRNLRTCRKFTDALLIAGLLTYGLYFLLIGCNSYLLAVLLTYALCLLLSPLGSQQIMDPAACLTTSAREAKHMSMSMSCRGR